MSTPVLVWLYKAVNTDELKFSIRSLTATLPNSGVLIVGDRPDWYKGEHIPVPTSGSHNKTSNSNTWRALATIAESRLTPERIVLCNDDMFCLRKQRTTPTFHRGPLDVQLERLRKTHRLSRYTAMLTNVKRVLEINGYEPRFDYETHTPMPMTKEGLKETLEVRARHMDIDISKRSLYGNIVGAGGRIIPGPIPGELDVKVRRASDPEPIGPWLSTNERAFIERYAKTLAEKYPEPSEYER